jgi:signal peptidase I
MASRSSRRTRSARGSSSRQSKGTAGSLLRFIAGVAILAWVLRSFIVQPFFIPSGSMLPTLYIGDYLLVAKWPFGYSRYSFPLDLPSFEGRLLGSLPRRGDVVVFRHPVEKSDLIKRVIGLPGDMIEMRAGRLVLNGQVVQRRRLDDAAVPTSPNSPCRVAPGVVAKLGSGKKGAACVYRAYLESLPGGPSYVVLDQLDGGPADDFPAARVPAGHLFLMGDNRDDSLDSRFPPVEGGVGMLPMQNLVGRALFTFWSTDGSASYVRPWSWFTALRFHRLGNGYTSAGK